MEHKIYNYKIITLLSLVEGAQAILTLSYTQFFEIRPALNRIPLTQEGRGGGGEGEGYHWVRTRRGAGRKLAGRGQPTGQPSPTPGSTTTLSFFESGLPRRPPARADPAGHKPAEKHRSEPAPYPSAKEALLQLQGNGWGHWAGELGAKTPR